MVYKEPAPAQDEKYWHENFMKLYKMAKEKGIKLELN